MNQRKILKSKLFLYLTEFFAGMSLMAVELGASRLLAPYFSSSQIVWTIIIGTIMIAMALGNLWGGRAADKNPDPDRLYIRLMIAALWIAAIPVAGKYVIAAITAVLAIFVKSNFLIWAAFAACMIIFVFPLLLLGTVSPSLVKYTVDNLQESGSTVGKLNALNTIGSILGTFLPTFVTIPAVGTSVTFLIFSGVLLALCFVYFLSSKAKQVSCGVTAGLYLLCCFLSGSGSFAFWSNDLLYEGESIYNYLQVSETPDEVILSTNVMFGVQSIKEKSGGLTGMYYDYALAAPLMAGGSEDTALDILILGNGTGTYATQCQQYFPAAHIEGVEIDGDITRLAYEYFDLSEEVEVSTYDGRAYLDAADKRYDVIMVDAYQDITIPFQMSSVEFFTLVREHLKDTGVMVVNLNMVSDASGSINEALCDTISSVFNTVYTADVSLNTNRELFAANSEAALELFDQRRSDLTDLNLRSQMYTVSQALTHYEAGSVILTDDKAPVELLGMHAIDELIQGELAYYQDLYAQGGLSALLNELM